MIPLLRSRPCLRRTALGALAVLGAASCSRPAVVDDRALAAADADTANWLSYGRTYAEQRMSPLRQIDERSVEGLKLAWWADLETLHGLEATSLVADGVLYTTSAFSVVYAFDARTGTRLWKYDPQVPKDHGKFACCDVVNRGVALYRGRIYVATIDGRLVAIDAKTGEARLVGADDAAGRAVRHHRRAANRQGARRHRERGIGVRSARVRRRLQRRNRSARLAQLHGAG